MKRILWTLFFAVALLALGTAAGITVLMLAGSLWPYLSDASASAPYVVQSALSGIGYFAIAWLANQLSTRLASEGQRARQSQLAASIQRQVNELVIESLPDGVMIVDEHGCVRSANPAARTLLGSQQALHAAVFDLRDEPGWAPLLNLMRLSVNMGQSHEGDVTIRHGTQGPLRVHARTRLATSPGLSAESLCVIFLQDQRKLEASMRTEKLAGMGRLSTAVAHEIRNPLSAISQANALLDEDITDPRLKRLTAMVSQNAKRLEKIVNDILNVARVQPYDQDHLVPGIPLTTTTHRICTDWALQCACQQRLSLHLGEQNISVQFDNDHLRRVLVNLLDNALQVSPAGQEVTVTLERAGDRVRLRVADRGLGLNDAQKARALERFWRGAQTTPGTGLGLPIAVGLTEASGGGLSLADRPGGGLLVELWLPCSA